MIIKWCIVKMPGRHFKWQCFLSLSLAMESKQSILVLCLAAHQSKYKQSIDDFIKYVANKCDIFILIALKSICLITWPLMSSTSLLNLIGRCRLKMNMRGDRPGWGSRPCQQGLEFPHLNQVMQCFDLVDSFRGRCSSANKASLRMSRVGAGQLAVVWILAKV